MVKIIIYDYAAFIMFVDFKTQQKTLRLYSIYQNRYEKLFYKLQLSKFSRLGRKPLNYYLK